MIDVRLGATALLLVAAAALAARVWPPRTTLPKELLDLAAGPVIAGLVVGRLVAMAIDDPSGMSRPGDLLIIRGGMEFWPGLAAGAAWATVAARRADVAWLERLADLAPYGLVAVGVYEATCLIRDGCFGPAVRAGLRPPGTAAPQLPVGVLVGAVLFAFAIACRRVGTSRASLAILVAIGGLSATRAASGFVLPAVGDIPTRPHAESLVVLAATVVVAVARLVRTTTASRST